MSLYQLQCQKPKNKIKNSVRQSRDINVYVFTDSLKFFKTIQLSFKLIYTVLSINLFQNDTCFIWYTTQ